MMKNVMMLPDDFSDYLTIKNTSQRFTEAIEVAEKVQAFGVPLLSNSDHVAIFCNPPHIVSGALKEVGYITGWDTRCYPSPVDGCDYINIPARLPPDNPARKKGWFDYVAVVHPVDQQALNHMLSQKDENPFIHHLTLGIIPPEQGPEETNFEYASQIIPFMVDIRRKISQVLNHQPGTLIIALPAQVIAHKNFEQTHAKWFGNLTTGEYQIESMQGGGYLIQFFVLTGGRIEIALRYKTTQTFNPKSVHKISENEISAIQT